MWDVDLGCVRSTKPACVRCDWECFRDPTELMGPAIDIYRNPLPAIRRLFSDEKRRLWLKDVLYHYACGFFNGRKPPDYRRMRRFG